MNINIEHKVYGSLIGEKGDKVLSYTSGISMGADALSSELDAGEHSPQHATLLFLYRHEVGRYTYLHYQAQHVNFPDEARYYHTRIISEVTDADLQRVGYHHAAVLPLLPAMCQMKAVAGVVPASAPATAPEVSPQAQQHPLRPYILASIAQRLPLCIQLAGIAPSELYADAVRTHPRLSQLMAVISSLPLPLRRLVSVGFGCDGTTPFLNRLQVIAYVPDAERPMPEGGVVVEWDGQQVRPISAQAQGVLQADYSWVESLSPMLQPAVVEGQGIKALYSIVAIREHIDELLSQPDYAQLAQNMSPLDATMCSLLYQAYRPGLVEVYRSEDVCRLAEAYVIGQWRAQGIKAWEGEEATSPFLTMLLANECRMVTPQFVKQLHKEGLLGSLQQLAQFLRRLPLMQSASPDADLTKAFEPVVRQLMTRKAQRQSRLTLCDYCDALVELDGTFTVDVTKLDICALGRDYEKRLDLIRQHTNPRISSLYDGLRGLADAYIEKSHPKKLSDLVKLLTTGEPDIEVLRLLVDHNEFIAQSLTAYPTLSSLVTDEAKALTLLSAVKSKDCVLASYNQIANHFNQFLQLSLAQPDGIVYRLMHEPLKLSADALETFQQPAVRKFVIDRVYKSLPAKTQQTLAEELSDTLTRLSQTPPKRRGKDFDFTWLKDYASDMAVYLVGRGEMQLAKALREASDLKPSLMLQFRQWLAEHRRKLTLWGGIVVAVLVIAGIAPFVGGSGDGADADPDATASASHADDDSAPHPHLHFMAVTSQGTDTIITRADSAERHAMVALASLALPQLYKDKMVADTIVVSRNAEGSEYRICYDTFPAVQLKYTADLVPVLRSYYQVPSADSLRFAHMTLQLNAKVNASFYHTFTQQSPLSQFFAADTLRDTKIQATAVSILTSQGDTLARFSLDNSAFRRANHGDRGLDRAVYYLWFVQQCEAHLDSCRYLLPY